MFRTRDFFLGLVCVVFIVLVGVVLYSGSASVLGTSVVFGEASEPTVYTAEVPMVLDTRAERMASLRAKLAERTILATDTSEEPIDLAPSSEPPSTDTATTTVTTPAVLTCATYRSLQIPWSPQTIIAEDREGMRVYFERGLPDGSVDAFGQPVPAPEIVRARIPQRTWPLATSSCLPTDVIGIGTDGSLMRNDELALYTVFGGSTLVGYALDGFPIYGQSPDIVTDDCGGAMVAGQYRYILDADRPGLITCFAGIPTALQ